MSDSLRPLGLYSPWNSPGQNTGVGSLSLLQGIVPTQGSNPGLPHCSWILYQLSHWGSSRILEWVAYPFSSGSSRPRNWTGSPALQVDSLPNELVEKKRFQICFFPFNRKNHLIKIRRSRLCIVLPLWYDLTSVINSSTSWLLVCERKWLDQGFFQLSKLLILWISYSSQSLLW